MQQMHRELLIQVCTMARSENKDVVIIEDSDDDNDPRKLGSDADVISQQLPAAVLLSQVKPLPRTAAKQKDIANRVSSLCL